MTPAPTPFCRPVGRATAPVSTHHAKLAAAAAVFLVCIHSKSEAAATLFKGETSQSEFRMIYRSEVFSGSRNFSNYGRSTTLSIESVAAEIVADEFYLLDNKIVSGSQMITNPTTFETSSISLSVTFTEFSLTAFADSALLQNSKDGNLSFFPRIEHSPVTLRGEYLLTSDSGASISGDFDTIVDLIGFRRDHNSREPMIGVGDFPISVDYADRELLGYSGGSFTLFSEEIDGIPITMNLERFAVGRSSSLEFYSLVPEPSGLLLLGATSAFALLRRGRQRPALAWASSNRD